MSTTFKFTRSILQHPDGYQKFISILAERRYDFSVKRVSDDEMLVTVQDITISDKFDAINEFGGQKA